VNQSLVDTEKLLKLLNEPTEVNDKPNAPDLIVENGEIEFENVNFSYDGRTTALNGVSFKVPKGSSVALVGESGAGKSTILRLLYRFYDLKEGEGRILIDGQDIRDVTQKSLRKAIGVVPQDTVLFNASISYNIGYGKLDSSPGEIQEAAKSAQMHDRVVTFPDGYNTIVGERGVRLSGGEKQRVAIARTLLKNPPILLLDEATSALDTSTEKDIQKALQNLVQGRSSLSIAHRLSTIASADIILVLKDGQIIEQGNHKELLALDGVFASMWADQISLDGDQAIFPGDSNVKEEVTGYSAEPSESALVENDLVESPAPILEQSAALIETSDVGSESLPVTETMPASGPESAEPTAASEPAAVTFPTSEPTADVAFPSADTELPSGPELPSSSATSAPLAFPASPDSDTPAQQPERPGPVGVTFGTNLNSPPSRSGTPDPEAEPKRKRISSQNFQRLARRISLTTRRQGSSSSISNIIPGLKRDSPRVSTDDASLRGERNSNDSPTASLQGDKDKDKGKSKKKDKKDKRKSTI